MPKAKKDTHEGIAPTSGQDPKKRTARQEAKRGRRNGHTHSAAAISPSLHALKLGNIPGLRITIAQEPEANGMVGELWGCYANAKHLLQGQRPAKPEDSTEATEAAFAEMMEEIRGWYPAGTEINIEEWTDGCHFVAYHTCGCPGDINAVVLAPLYNAAAGNRELTNLLSSFISVFVYETGISWWGCDMMEVMEMEREDYYDDDDVTNDRAAAVADTLAHYKHGRPMEVADMIMDAPMLSSHALIEAAAVVPVWSEKQAAIRGLVQHCCEFLRDNPGCCIDFSRYREDGDDSDGGQLEYDMRYILAWSYDEMYETYVDYVTTRADEVGMYDPVATMWIKKDTKSLPLDKFAESLTWPERFYTLFTWMEDYLRKNKLV